MLWLLIANLLLTAVGLTHVVDIDRQTRKRIGMSTQETINAVVAQLGKAKGEIISKIADLQIQLDDANVADKVDITELVAAAQSLDDIVPDVVEAEPVEDDEDEVEEVPAEVVVESEV